LLITPLAPVGGQLDAPPAQPVGTDGDSPTLAAPYLTPGTWAMTALWNGGLFLSNGVTYRVGAYTGGGAYYWRYDLASNIPYGVINQSYEAGGEATLWPYADPIGRGGPAGCVRAIQLRFVA